MKQVNGKVTLATEDAAGTNNCQEGKLDRPAAPSRRCDRLPTKVTQLVATQRLVLRLVALPKRRGCLARSVPFPTGPRASSGGQPCRDWGPVRASRACPCGRPCVASFDRCRPTSTHALSEAPLWGNHRLDQ